MKGKKILAGILSAAMVLGTMVMPAFAAIDKEAASVEVDNSADFLYAISNESKATYIKLTKSFDVDQNHTDPYLAANGTKNIEKDCTIDLGEYTLGKGEITWFETSKNVTFTGVAGKAKMTWDSISTAYFRPTGTMNFENITFSGGASDCYVLEANGGTINVNNCYFDDVYAAAGVVVTNQNGIVNIEDTTITTTGKAIGGYVGDCVLSGNTVVKGTTSGSVWAIGNNVSCPDAKVPAAMVKTSAGDEKYYEDFDEAFAVFTKDGIAIKLFKDSKITSSNIECKVTESKTIDLNGKTLELAGVFAAFRGNWTITGDADRKSKIKLSGNCKDSDSLLSVGWYNANGSSLTVTGTTIEAPQTYAAPCGLIGAYFGSSIHFDNVNVVDTQNIETHPDACKTIFYGEALDSKCTIDLKNVDVETIEVEKIIGNCNNVNIDGFTFTGKITEYALQVLGNAVIKNATFTFDDDNKKIIALYRDAGFENNISFENAVFDKVPECEKGIFLIANESSSVSADENTSVISKAGQTAFAAKVTASNGTDTMYPTLADAIASAQDGETVTLLTNLSGDGIEIKANTFKTGLTIDLGGYTYTVDGNLKGSTNTESNGFYFERGNVITIQNGTITSSKNAKYYSKNDKCDYNTGILVQNHTESLTLKNVTLDGSNLRDEVFSYTLGNDNGTVNITNSKIIANTDGTKAFAFDADKSGSSYDFKGVYIDKDSVVTGYMQVTSGGLINCGGVDYTTNGTYYKQGDKLVNMTTASNDRSIKAEANKDAVRAGETFEVKVVLNADDIASAGFKMTYDPSLFRLVSDPTNNGEITFFDNAGGFAGTYTNGAILTTYTFEALAQSNTKTGSFTLSNTRAYTYEENRLGMTFEVSNVSDDVTINLNSFNATVKLDGKAVKTDSATLNYDGKEHSVVISVEPKDYKSVEMTYTVNGKQKYGEPVIKEPGTYVIDYNVVAYDGYESCSGKFTLTILEPNAYYVEVNTGVGKKADYVAGKKLVLVYTDLSNVAFKYNGKDMIEVTKSIGNYQYSGSETDKTNFSHVYAYVTEKTNDNTFKSYEALVTPFIIKDGYKIEKIDKYGFDINNKEGIDEQDPGTAIGVYGALNVYYDNHDAQKNILKADVNGDKCVTPEDVKDVTLAAFGK